MNSDDSPSFFRRLMRSAGVWHGVAMSGATILAGGLDYLYNVATGRLLLPEAYSGLLAVTALLQILLHLTNVIRNVVAYYCAEIRVDAGSSKAIAPFLRNSFRWAWRWGLISTLLMLLISPLLRRPLQLPDNRLLWAGSLAVLMLFVRPVSDGALQGVQRFWGLAGVILTQAILRLALALGLIGFGLGAVGAMLALPLATSLALLPALWQLRPYLHKQSVRTNSVVSWHYSAQTLVGLGAFALLTNSDALLVRGLFASQIAGNYAPLVTLGKINLFVPLALAMVLFPKAVERHRTGQQVAPILFASLGLAILPGLALTALFFIAPSQILDIVFGGQYDSLGRVMGLVGLATTLYAGISIWLNFALSTERTGYVPALGVVAVGQIAGMLLFHQTVEQMVGVMVLAGIAGNLLGVWQLQKSSVHRQMR